MRLATALTVVLSLALAGTASAAPKDPGLGDRVEFRFHKNGKLRMIDGLAWAYAKVDYRCAPAPGLVVADGDLDFVQRFPDGSAAGAPGWFVDWDELRCTGRWRTMDVAAEGTGFAGGPPFQKGPVRIRVRLLFTDWVSITRQGRAEGTVILR